MVFTVVKIKKIKLPASKSKIEISTKNELNVDPESLVVKIKKTPKVVPEPGQEFSRFFFGYLNNGIPDYFGLGWILITLTDTATVFMMRVHGEAFDCCERKPIWTTVATILAIVWLTPLLMLGLVKWSNNELFREDNNPRTVLSLLGLYGGLLWTYSRLKYVIDIENYFVQWNQMLLTNAFAAMAVIAWLRHDIFKSRYTSFHFVITGLLFLLYSWVLMVLVYSQRVKSPVPAGCVRRMMEGTCFFY